MTKAIAALIIALLLYGGWHFFLYWEKIRDQEQLERKQSAQAATLGNQLPGMPPGLESSLDAAKRRGAEGLGAWLNTHGSTIQDPRKAWIELDYVMLLSRGKPSEAKKLFAAVKNRTGENSPVWPRIKQMEKTYE
jgi:hypothetical protein